jgi:hypothetical protein
MPIELDTHVATAGRLIPETLYWMPLVTDPRLISKRESPSIGKCRPDQFLPHVDVDSEELLRIVNQER